MSYEKLIEYNLEKTGFWGAAGKAALGAGKAGFNFGKGMLGIGAAKGVSTLSRGANIGGMAYGALGPVMSTVMPNQKASPSISAGPFSLAMPKTAGAKTAYTIKKSFGVGDAIDAGSYAAFLGSKFIPHDNPWHNRLDALGLLGLGGTTAHSLITNPGDRTPSAKDLAGLALMGWALKDRVGQHSP